MNPNFSSSMLAALRRFMGSRNNESTRAPGNPDVGSQPPQEERMPDGPDRLPDVDSQEPRVSNSIPGNPTGGLPSQKLDRGDLGNRPGLMNNRPGDSTTPLPGVGNPSNIPGNPAGGPGPQKIGQLSNITKFGRRLR
jgi:hypothetical protein